MRGCFKCFPCLGKPTIPTADDKIAFQFVEKITNSFNDDDNKVVDANVEKLQRCGSRVISVIGASATSNHPLSFVSLAEAAEGVRKVNSQARRAMSNSKFSKNPELQHLVDDFLKKQADVLQSFAGVKQWILKAREGEALIRAAIARFEDGDHDSAFEHLREFEAKGETLTESFLRAFEVALEQQRSIMKDLHVQSEKLDQKLKSVKAWKKLYVVLYMATFVGALICSVVLDAVSGQSAAFFASAAVTSAVNPLGEWLNKVWNKYDGKFMDEKKMVDDLGEKSSFVVREMEGIRSAVKNLEEKIGAMRSKVKVAEEGGGVWEALVKDIKTNADEFTASVAMLEKVVHQSERDLWWISAITAGDTHNLLSNLWITLQKVLLRLESEQRKGKKSASQ